MVCVETLADWWNEIGCISSVFSSKINPFDVLCAQLTRDLFAVAKFLLHIRTAWQYSDRDPITWAKIAIFDQYLARDQ